jgi:O-acetyl-ADP-ribose deacetylase (regulator of RNase III)
MTPCARVPAPRGVLYVEGDLLQYPSTYLAHQCNCVTTGAQGLAAAIFK